MKIFISYRRDDSSYVTDRIYEHIARYYDQKDVFRDVESIDAGTDFRITLTRAVQQCNAVLAVIGSRWLTMADSTGQRRLWNPDDYVRIEIETALARGIPLIPLLIEGVAIPRTDELPPTLSELPSRQYVTVRKDPDFEQDMERLITAMHRLGLDVPGRKTRETLRFGDLGL